MKGADDAGHEPGVALHRLRIRPSRAEPPEACPVCGAPRELFEPQADSPPPAAEPCREPMAMPGLRVRPRRSAAAHGVPGVRGTGRLL